LDINIPVKTHKLCGPKFPLPQHVFDLLTSKWGHASPMCWASFLPIFSFLYRSVLDLRVGRHGTDRWTNGRRDDGNQCIMGST